MRKAINNKYIVLGLLALAYTLSFMDRYVMNLLLAPAKRDFNLSDTQVSLLAGASFALFYAIMGLPLGRLSDTTKRTKLMALGIALWSIATAACGMAKNFVHLILARVGVGVGEAALSPSAYSLIADYFPKRMLATAIAVYSSGIYIGAGLAYIGGGHLLAKLEPLGSLHLPIIGNAHSWQIIFMLFALPGLLLAAVVLLVAEPVRQHIALGHSSLRMFFRYIVADGKAFLYLCAASAVFNIAVYATGVWIPTFLNRVHHIPMLQVGTYTGVGIMLLSPIGVILGGRIADKWSMRQGLTGRLNTIILALLCFIPASVAYTFTTGVEGTLWALVPYGLLVSAGVAVTATMVQEMVPTQYKGTAAAMLLFCQNIIGLGLGPTLVALLTDKYFTNEMMIGKSLMIVCLVSLSVSLALFILCRRKLTTDN